MSFTATMPTTSSLSLLRVIPLTPEAPRPIGRVLLSSNLIAFPDFTANITWLLPVVSFASKRTSPSLMLIALMPLVLGREYCSNEVFFTWPFLVAIIT